MCMAVLFLGLTGECCKRMIRLGAHQSCSAITQGLWGIWSCTAFLGCLQLGSSPPRSPYTHRFNCLCFFHYFYCLSSALRAPRACGKVIVMAVVCLQPQFLWLAANSCGADAGGEGCTGDLQCIDFHHYFKTSLWGELYFKFQSVCVIFKNTLGLICWKRQCWRCIKDCYADNLYANYFIEQH